MSTSGILEPGVGGDGGEDDSFDEDDSWSECQTLMETIDDVELTDPSTASERLLYRLFHEHGVRVFEPTPVLDNCSCSEDSIRSVLSGFTPDQIAESVEEDGILVTCEFCSKSYSFLPSEFVANH